MTEILRVQLAGLDRHGSRNPFAINQRTKQVKRHTEVHFVEVGRENPQQDYPIQ